jgi:hypothetical protein
VEIGVAAAQIDSDLLLHHRQIIGEDLDLDAGEIEKSLEIVADRERGRRVLAHEHELGAAVLLPLGVVRRGGIGGGTGDHRVQPDRDRADAQRRDGAAAEFEKSAAADPLIDRIPRYLEH